MFKYVKQIFRIISKALLAIVLLIILTLLSFWIELKFNRSLPMPTGGYLVGRTTLHWVDSTRLDSLSPPPHVKRELIVWVWYPASVDKTNKIVAYDHAEWGKGLNSYRNFLFRNFFYRDGSRIHAYSYLNAKISDKQTRYPIILMRSGIGREATGYTCLAEELASHGYIVIGSDAPYSTFKTVYPDGRVIEKTAPGNPGEAEYVSEYRNRVLNRLVKIWSADARFILDRIEQINLTDAGQLFWQHADVNSVGIFGHSFGGATAAQFCYDDSRCKVGVDLDGVPYGNVIREGLNKPFMFLLADHSDDTDAVSKMIKSSIESIYKSSPQNHIWLHIKGAQHFNFSDFPFQSEFVITRITGAVGTISRQRAIEVSSKLLLTFFDKHLKGKPDSILQLSKKYPEVIFERHFLSSGLPVEKGLYLQIENGSCVNYFGK